MRWHHSFPIAATPDDVYRFGFAADRWFTFYPGYQGVEAVDADWPAEGSSLVVRFGMAGPLAVRLRQRVVRHDHGRLIRMHEEAMGGFWVDRPEFRLEPRGDGTRVQLTVDPTSRFLLARPLIFAIALPFMLITPRAMRRFAAMIEAGARGEQDRRGDGGSD